MKIVMFEGVKLHIDEKSTLSTKEVALAYGVAPQAIRTHKMRQADELLKGIHYIEVWDDKFKRYVTRWTLDGVHMLGFFIKSERAKAFRKFTAKLLSEIKKGNVRVSTPAAPAGCPAERFDSRINGYKSQIAQKNKKIEDLRWELAAAKTKLQELESRKIADGDWILAEHNLLDLVGALSCHKEELDTYGQLLETIAKEHKKRTDFIDRLLNNLVKHHPKTRNVAETAKTHTRKWLQDVKRMIE